MRKASLNIIGAGKTGKTLGFLWANGPDDLAIQAILNQSLPSAQAAVDFIGQGRAVASFEELPPADLTLLSVPDRAIESTCQAWVLSRAARPGSVLFHLSGALSSSTLKAAAEKGVYIASVHPLKSFAEPAQASATFSGTLCAIEGDEKAIDVLWPLFEAIGGALSRIDPDSKTLYHAACVMACGGLTALYASAEKLLIESGIQEETVKKILGPYMKLTIDNNTALGSVKALTGPVARGDQATLIAHEAALQTQSERVQSLYSVLTQLQMNL